MASSYLATAPALEAFIRPVGQNDASIESRLAPDAAYSRRIPHKQLARKRDARPVEHALDDTLAALAQFDEQKALAIELRDCGTNALRPRRHSQPLAL